MGSMPVPMPTVTNMRAIMKIMMKAMITAIMLMARALSLPQSKKIKFTSTFTMSCKRIVWMSNILSFLSQNNYYLFIFLFI
jgi:hypothetical protein